jgi:hypothetical protein
VREFHIIDGSSGRAISLTSCDSNIDLYSQSLESSLLSGYVTRNPVVTAHWNAGVDDFKFKTFFELF